MPIDNCVLFHARKGFINKAWLPILLWMISEGYIEAPLLQVISIVLMLTRPRGEGLSDLVLGTVALNRRATM